MEKFNEFISMVKQRTDISQEIGKYITLDKNNKTLCPFHDDRSPSLSVNTKKQYFHCFGCGTGGDVFRFLELYTHKPFIEILTYLEDIGGIHESGKLAL